MDDYPPLALTAAEQPLACEEYIATLPLDLTLPQDVPNGSLFDLSLFFPGVFGPTMCTTFASGQDNLVNGSLPSMLPICHNINNIVDISQGSMPTPDGQLYEYASVADLSTSVIPQVFPSTSQASDSSFDPLAWSETVFETANPIIHVYRPLVPSIEQTMNNWMEPYVNHTGIGYRCTWPNCIAEPATKREACSHVHDHLGITKLYECACGRQFSTLRSAKRHSDTQKKRFKCGVCRKGFARKDYCKVHQRRCTSQPLN